MDKTGYENYVNNFRCQVWYLIEKTCWKNVHNFKHTKDLAYALFEHGGH